jgi:8-oxo-dGTP pyrophosphatase MutT (NUDIX family)
MQLRDIPIPFPNMWNFPGGAVKPHETVLEGAIREVFEEFEIQISPTICREIWRYTRGHAATDHIFLCAVPASTISVLHEGAAWSWMTLDEIAELELSFEQAKIRTHISQGYQGLRREISKCVSYLFAPLYRG